MARFLLQSDADHGDAVLTLLARGDGETLRVSMGTIINADASQERVIELVNHLLLQSRPADA